MTTTAGDVISAVLADHQEIKQLFEQMSGSGARNDDTFRQLIRKLAVHETAEEEIVHPLARKVPGGDEVVDARLQEEDEGKKVLADLEKMGVGDPQFDALFAKLRSAVLAHAEHEETMEHPLIRQNTDGEVLERAAGRFRTAESMAPTHAHAAAPESATGNMTVGMFVAVADKVRDALKKDS